MMDDRRGARRPGVFLMCAEAASELRRGCSEGAPGLFRGCADGRAA